ncbi:MAG TPA: lyase family protein [Humibacter sp.]|nr:lyase family protein [Humibacter sp.]
MADRAAASDGAFDGAFDWGLLEPAGADGGGLGDDAVLAAMIAVEQGLISAWAQLDGGAAPRVDRVRIDRDALRDGVRRDGVAVVDLVRQLREQVGDDADRVHRGATSQDVLDTALVLASRDALAAAGRELAVAGRALAALADVQRGTPVIARTLTQPAEPTTLGAESAAWLNAVTSALEALGGLAYPVQLGGAVGTGSAFVRISGREDAPRLLRAALARTLGLADPGRAWHTDRSPVLSIAAAAGHVCAAAGRIGRGLAFAARDGVLLPEHGGGSSAMPHKKNPVDAVILIANGLRAGGLIATLQTASLSFDARPAGEWHAEWQAWRGLLRLAVESAAVLARATADLVVHAPDASQPAPDADGDTAPDTALAAAGAVVDPALERFAALEGPERADRQDRIGEGV